jgi:hypothetical protein
MSRNFRSAFAASAAAMMLFISGSGCFAKTASSVEPTTLLPDAVLLTMPVKDQIAATNSLQFQCPSTKQSVDVRFSPRTEPARVTVSVSYRKDTPDPPIGGLRVIHLPVRSRGGGLKREACLPRIFDWGPEWAFKEGKRSWIGGLGRTATIGLVTLGQPDRKYLLINADDYQPFSNGQAVLRVIDLADLRRKYLIDMGEREGFSVKVEGPQVTVGGFYVGNGPMSDAKAASVALRYNPLTGDVWPQGSAGLGSSFFQEKADWKHSIEFEQVRWVGDWLGQLTDPNFCRKQKAVDVAKWDAKRLNEAHVRYLPEEDGLHFIMAVDLDGHGLDGVLIVSQDFSPFVEVILSSQGCAAGTRRMSRDDFMRVLSYIHHPVQGAGADLPELPVN